MQTHLLMFIYQHREQIPISLLSEFVDSLSCGPQLFSDWSRVNVQLLASHCLHATNGHQMSNEKNKRNISECLPFSLLSSSTFGKHSSASFHPYSFSSPTYAMAAELCSSLKSDVLLKSVDLSAVWNVPCPFYVSDVSEQLQLTNVLSSQLLGASAKMSSELSRSACDALIQSEDNGDTYAPMAVG